MVCTAFVRCITQPYNLEDVYNVTNIIFEVGDESLWGQRALYVSFISRHDNVIAKTRSFLLIYTALLFVLILQRPFFDQSPTPALAPLATIFIPAYKLASFCTTSSY